MRTRLERAVDKRDDIEHYIAKWGWARTPSELRALERRLAKARAKVARLATPTPTERESAEESDLTARADAEPGRREHTPTCRLTRAAAALTPLFAEERRKAWDEGESAGYENAVFDDRGSSSDADAHEFPRPNPYRERADTYAEEGES